MLQLVEKTDPLEVEEAIMAFAAARGNVHLAAEKLHIPPTRVRALIAEDPDLLLKHLRTQTIISLFELASSAHDNLKVSIPGMEPYEQSKTYTSLMQIISSMSTPSSPSSSSSTSVTNVQLQLNQILSQVPPEIREALDVILQPPPTALPEPTP